MHDSAWALPLSFAVALGLIAWLRRSRLAAFALDHPNHRSLHDVAVPRVGGFGVLAGAFVGWIIVHPALPSAFGLALVLLILVSLADDVRRVPSAVRFVVHIIAAGLAVHAVLADHDVLLGALALLTVAWMINLYNFMDGSDGLAGGMTLFGFSFYGIAAWTAGDHAFALLNFSIAAASGAFLCFNFHPARVFLGDVGSVPLGFMAAVFGMMGWLQHDWTWWFPALVFSPFIVDATLTLARRAARGERPWEAHRSHYYQRLIRMKWSHRKTALAEYALMVACGVLALAALYTPAAMRWVLLGIMALGYVALALSVDRMWTRFQRAVES